MSRRFACTLATRPRPKVERFPASEHALARHAAAGALGGGERLGDEGLGPLAARRADAAWARLEIILVSHRRPRQCAEKPGPAKRCGSSAPCAPGPHIAGSLKNPNKNNRPTEPHLAAFYLALGRLVSALLPCLPFLLPGRTLCRACLRNRALIAAMQPPGTSEAAEPTGKARADRGDVAAHRRESGAITASAPLRKRGRTAHRIAVRWPTGRAPRRQAASRSTAVWLPRDRQVQRLPIAR